MPVIDGGVGESQDTGFIGTGHNKRYDIQMNKEENSRFLIATNMLLQKLQDASLALQRRYISNSGH